MTYYISGYQGEGDDLSATDLGSTRSLERAKVRADKALASGEYRAVDVEFDDPSSGEFEFSVAYHVGEEI